MAKHCCLATSVDDMLFAIQKIPDNQLAGLGTNLHKITTNHGDILAYLAIKDKEVVVYFNKIIKYNDMKHLSEFINLNIHKMK